MVRRFLILGAAALLLPGCLATGAAKAVQGALGQAEPPVVHVQAPDVSVTFEDITFQQVPIGALETLTTRPAEDADAEPADPPAGDPQPEAAPLPDPGPEAAPEADAAAWIHAEPLAENPDPFDRGVIRDALGPVFRDLDDRIESIDDRLSSMEGG